MAGIARETRQLRGKRIVITRARHQSPPLEDLIRALGGRPVPYPCIAIAPALDLPALDDRLRRLHSFDWLLLTSGNAARAVAEGFARLGIVLDSSSVQVAVVGPGTAAEARRRLACDIHHMPAEYGAGQLARSLPISQPCRILLPQSDIADDSTARTLRARGADVTAAIAYRTVMGEGGADLPAMLSRREIDALTFTSPSALAFFCRRCPAPAARRLPAACIGAATAAAADAHGFQQLITPRQPSLNDMVSDLADFFAESSAAP